MNYYEQANQYLSVDYSEGERPQELDVYLNKIRQADFYHNPLSSTSTTEHSHIDRRNRSGRLRLCCKTEECYGDALMYLCGVLDGRNQRLANEV